VVGVVLAVGHWPEQQVSRRAHACCNAAAGLVAVEVVAASSALVEAGLAPALAAGALGAGAAAVGVPLAGAADLVAGGGGRPGAGRPSDQGRKAGHESAPPDPGRDQPGHPVDPSLVHRSSFRSWALGDGVGCDGLPVVFALAIPD
jgi:hypothetical protein